MRLGNTICISKKKAVRHYADLIVKVFEENSKITQGFECSDFREWGLLRSRFDVCG